ncbi:hypothetical protein VspSw1_127 [Vibrio phage VspSw_1]|uniref:Uncharacterized protein n=1 Tax=Vibrio phage VspSw_1 TaxID=2484249 RepID=A0A411BKP4_9CAUD|nr:hypothetical protein HOV08_gp127 [Vibrio phage VspSw_1]QAY02195.1 hypothetical protein VspSw1_127 [Vibrio phage VspSw_1]
MGELVWIALTTLQPFPAFVPLEEHIPLRAIKLSEDKMQVSIEQVARIYPAIEDIFTNENFVIFSGAEFTELPVAHDGEIVEGLEQLAEASRKGAEAIQSLSAAIAKLR